ncbi:MAG: hypothetical protein ACFB0C_25105 [Leptolyngbyaceae cyanobacterium]
MITIRTMKHVATSRTIPSFRSCPSLDLSNPSALIDQGRMVTGYAQMMAQETRRQHRRVRLPRP